MIIVKTKNGAKFINEREAVMVCHDKEAKNVSFHTRETMQGVTIHDVESVTFATDANPMEWKDEGLEVERLKKRLDKLRECGNNLRSEYLKIEQERDELKERVAELEANITENSAAGIFVKDISDLGFSVRVHNILKQNDIETVADLTKLRSRELLKLRNGGIASLREIVTFFDKYGMDLR